MSFNLYTFGCSFTKYIWPTWADILGNYADNYKNFGKIAAGNYFIFHEVVDFVAQHDFQENDIVAICWSNFFREDRIKDNDWQHSGPLWLDRIKFYDNDFLSKYFDVEHYIKRDKTFIIATIELLEAKKIKYVMFSLDDIFFSTQKSRNFFHNFLAKHLVKRLKDIVKSIKVSDSSNSRYDKYLRKLLPAVIPYLDMNDDNRPLLNYKISDQVIKDFHPTPLEHLQYVEEVIIPNFPLNIKINEDHKQQLYNSNNEIMNKVNTI